MPLQPLLYLNLYCPLLEETKEIKFNKNVRLCVHLHQSTSLCESTWGYSIWCHRNDMQQYEYSIHDYSLFINYGDFE
jgi:hypothetical protein